MLRGKLLRPEWWRVPCWKVQKQARSLKKTREEQAIRGIGEARRKLPLRVFLRRIVGLAA